MTDAPMEEGGQPARFVRRHGLATRIWHWINAGTFVVLLMSGLMIFNAHPRLYWGQYGANPDPAWLEIGSMGERGVVRIGETTFTTTGVLGRYEGPEGEPVIQAFPGWMTLPSTYDLAGARRWHLTFSWLFGASLLAYAVASLINGHLWRDLVPRPRECAPTSLWEDCKKHAKLNFKLAEGAGTSRYNPLQKIGYIVVMLILLPVVLLTGLAMSPRADAVMPFLTEMWGGRQTARSVHFIAATALVVFTLIHVLLVLLMGPWNATRAMVTGRFRMDRGESR